MADLTNPELPIYTQSMVEEMRRELEERRDLGIRLAAACTISIEYSPKGEIPEPTKKRLQKLVISWDVIKRATLPLLCLLILPALMGAQTVGLMPGDSITSESFGRSVYVVASHSASLLECDQHSCQIFTNSGYPMAIEVDGALYLRKGYSYRAVKKQVKHIAHLVKIYSIPTGPKCKCLDGDL